MKQWSSTDSTNDLNLRSELFYVLNPNPADLATATYPSHLPSQPYKPELPTLVLVHSSASDTLHYARQFADPRITQSFNVFGADCMFNGWSKGAQNGCFTDNRDIFDGSR